MKINIACLFAMASLMSTSAINTFAQELKPRIVVLTDIAPASTEPDDMESMVRLLAHADLFEIEAIITTSGWNSSGGEYNKEWTKYLNQVIDAYEKDLPNLIRRSGQDKFESVTEESGRQNIGYWPSADYIRSRTFMGSRNLGVKYLGNENNSPGSEAIISLINESDPRPIWILGWGGCNTVAQALWKIKESDDKVMLGNALNKLRIYTITDQDVDWGHRGQYDISSHKWMRETFGDRLLFIWDESAWLSQNGTGSSNWDKYEKQIQGKGNLGKAYPKFKWGVEGDTPSFLYVTPNGLNDPDEPTQASWGGYFRRMLSNDGTTHCYTNMQDSIKSISQKYENYFYPATFNNFAARMAWAAEGKGNRNPEVVVNGVDGHRPIYITSKPGKNVSLDASRSYDPDGDNIDIRWWVLPEAGSCPVEPTISIDTDGKAKVRIPSEAKGSRIHIICEVTDDGDFNLKGYRRIIINVK